MVYGAGLENRYGSNLIVGSNPTPSANLTLIQIQNHEIRKEFITNHITTVILRHPQKETPLKVWARDMDAEHSFALLYEAQSHKDAAREFVHDGPYWTNGQEHLWINVVTWEGDLEAINNLPHGLPVCEFSLWTSCRSGNAELLKSSAEYRRKRRKAGHPSYPAPPLNSG